MQGQSGNVRLRPTFTAWKKKLTKFNFTKLPTCQGHGDYTIDTLTFLDVFFKLDPSCGFFPLRNSIDVRPQLVHLREQLVRTMLVIIVSFTWINKFNEKFFMSIYRAETARNNLPRLLDQSTMVQNSLITHKKTSNSLSHEYGNK